MKKQLLLSLLAFCCSLWSCTQNFESYKEKAEQGDKEAQYQVGRCYEKGEGVPVDKEKAVEWYKKAAEQGHAEAQFYLGGCYWDGDGVPVNKRKAVE